jgi:hypothetical protein
MSRKTHSENLRKAQLIELHGSPTKNPCDRCHKTGTICIMSSNRSSKCAHCLKLNKNCSHRAKTDNEFSRHIKATIKKQKELKETRSSLHELIDQISQIKARELRLQKELDFLSQKSFEFISPETPSLETETSVPSFETTLVSRTPSPSRTSIQRKFDVRGFPSL